MYERPYGRSGRRGHGEGDIRGSQHGDFTGFSDWDNPEDVEEAPEGNGGEDDDDSYVPGPDDPDYDLSEAGGYADWDAPRRSGPFPNWMIVAVSILLIIAILTPVLMQAR